MDKSLTNDLGEELYRAMTTRETVCPLTEREFDITIGDAYRISQRTLEIRVENGEKVIGKKIGLTSKVVQRKLGVNQPDFGFLTDAMIFGSGETVPISERLIQPRVEGEIAFVLKKDVLGPGVTAAEVIAATDFVMPCFEIVDSRIRDWRIKIEDTVADNASCGLIALGTRGVDVKGLDLITCGMVVEKNGEIISTGAGAAALGSPVNCVVWLANTLGELGMGLKAGEIILSGSLVPLEPVKQGDYLRLEISGIGSAGVRFD